MKRNKLKSKIKYYISGLIKYYWNEFLIRTSHELVLVYTMAKVGSTSFSAIYKKERTVPVFHFHTLNLDDYNNNRIELKKKGLYPDSRSNAKSILKHIQLKKKL